MIVSIARVNLARLDLNLLLTLDALLAERSVTRAARRLGLSQPAVSNALSRLREQLGDPLLVRRGAGMVLTPRAADIEPLLRQAIVALERAVTGEGPFDPRSAAVRFTLVATDYVEMVLLPALARRVSRAGPRISLDVRPIGEASPLDAVGSGAVDGALGVFLDPPAGFHRTSLLRERMTCVLRAGHPALVGAPLTLEAYARLSHLLVTPRRTGPAAIDRALEARGLSRHIALQVSHFLVAPLVVAATDLVATLPERAARLLAAGLPLAFLEPPVPSSGFEIVHLWHDRTHESPPHRWLRAQIAAAAEEAR